MRLSYGTLTQIIQSFAVSSGVPAFLIDESGAVHTASPGFCAEDYEFADVGQLRQTVVDGLACDGFTPDQYHTLYTEHQFIYNLVPVAPEDLDRQIVVAGPMRIQPPTAQELRAIALRQEATAQPVGDISERISGLPQVPMSRVRHLGCVQAALCRCYSEEGSLIPPRVDAASEVRPWPTEVLEVTAADIPSVSFTLVEEEIHVSRDFMTRLKEVVLSGDVAAIRELARQTPSAPVDRLIETDAVRSVRYNIITTCAIMVGMMFDQHVPYEQLMMTADRHIRKADRTADLNELMRLIWEAVEDFARLAKRYSSRNYSRPVRQILQYVQGSMRERISLQDLAARVELSPSYLSRLIRRETGMTLSEIVNSHRVNESKYLLLHTDHSILEIAQMVGYTYQNHFAEHFRTRTGMTPSRFRLSGGVGDASASSLQSGDPAPPRSP